MNHRDKFENRHEKFLKQMERYKRDAEKIKKGREAWIRAQAEWLRQSLGITKPIELTAASQAQLNAIGQFFHDHCFGRVAAVLTDRALLDPSLKPYAIVARSLLERIAEIARHHPISN